MTPPESPGALLREVAREMRERKINHGRDKSMTLIAWADRLDAIASSVEGKAEDAARYLWLRNRSGWGMQTGVNEIYAEDFEAAIDAARTAQQESES